jgi:uncharacterized membrane protein YraQ (UPF0718 family)
MAKRNKYIILDTSAVGTMQIAASSAVLEGIFVSSVGTSGTMMIYNDVLLTGATPVTPVIDTFTLTAGAGATYLGSIECSTGIYVETNGSPMVTFLTLSAD